MLNIDRQVDAFFGGGGDSSSLAEHKREPFFNKKQPVYLHAMLRCVNTVIYNLSTSHAKISAMFSSTYRVRSLFVTTL